MNPSVRLSWVPTEDNKDSETVVFAPPEDAPASRCEIHIVPQAPIKNIVVTSNARTCEVLSRRAEEGHSYAGTVQGKPVPGRTSIYELVLDIKKVCAASASSILLRMLSLSQRDRFIMHSLEINADELPASSVPEDPSTLAAASSASSQMDEVRALLESASGSGALSASGSAQDSKQQLMAAIARAVFLKQGRLVDTGARAVQMPVPISEGKGEKETSASASESQSPPSPVSSVQGVLEHLDQIQTSLNSLRLASGDIRQQPGLSEAAQCSRVSHKDPGVASGCRHSRTSSHLVKFETAMASAVDRAVEEFDNRIQAVLHKRLHEFEIKLHRQRT